MFEIYVGKFNGSSSQSRWVSAVQVKCTLGVVLYGRDIAITMEMEEKERKKERKKGDR
jgi:hypothetical protein